MNVNTIRDSLSTVLTTALPVATYGVRFYPEWPNRLAAPAATFERTAGPERLTFGSGTWLLTMEAVVIIHRASDVKRAHDKLDAFLATSGANSIIAALEANSTLSGAIECLLVGAVENDEAIQANGGEYVGCRIPIEIYGT